MTLFLALVLDWFVGDPERLWERIPHPVVLIGKVIDVLDHRLNQTGLSAAALRGRGTIALFVLVVASFLCGWILTQLFNTLGYLGWVLEIVLVAVFIAQKSLSDHVRAVVAALRSEGTGGGRRAVARIVGRDPEQLNDAGICRAAIESLAENFSDGVVAPAFWYMVLGLPGLLACKVVNTADSMIGHTNAKYLHFGRATALFDDAVNWPAARVSAFVIALAAGMSRGISVAMEVVRSTMRGAATHRSPNAGWPETAMAASLGIALGGPRNYDDIKVHEPMMNASARIEVTISDIEQALGMFAKSCFVIWMIAFISSLI